MVNKIIGLLLLTPTIWLCVGIILGYIVKVDFDDKKEMYNLIRMSTLIVISLWGLVIYFGLIW